MVVAEVVYVLNSKNLYNIDREKSVIALKIVLDQKNILVEEKSVILESLELFADSNLNFADCYLITKKEVGKYAGVLTFDKNLKKGL